MGALIPSQLGYTRPIPEFSQYRGPVDKLYLTGSGTVSYTHLTLPTKA